MTSRKAALHPMTEARIAALADHYEIDLLEEALRDDPSDFDVLVRLGELYSHVGRHQDGLVVDLRLVGMAPLDPIVHYNLACSLTLTGQVEDAICEMRKAVRLGYDELDHLMADTDLTPLREHEAFLDIVRMLERKRQPAR